MINRIKITVHPNGKIVINTPGSHLQRQPRTYTDWERAMARVAELKEMM